MSILREYVNELATHAQIRIAVGGDVMFGRYAGYDYKPSSPDNPFLEIQTTFEDADLSIVNLETVLMDSQPQWWDYHQLPSEKFSRQLVAPTSKAQTLKDAGIDLVSLANNHADDGGLLGYVSTQSALAAAGVGFTGTSLEGDPFTPTVLNVGGKQIVHFSVTFKRNLGESFGSVDDYVSPLAWLESIEDSRKFLDRVSRVRKEMSDSFIITSVHWGKQYSTRVLPWQETYARNLIDAGCNCILGHHPHVIQEIMSYNKGVVFFSLGNLFFDHHYEEKGHQHPKHPSTVMGSVYTIDISTEDNSVIDMRQILTLSSPKGVLIV